MLTRLLVSARDAGAAQQNRAFIESCFRARRGFQFEVLVQPPASLIFSGCPVSMREVEASPPASFISSVFERFRPDFVLVGLSGFGEGIDEMLLAHAKRHGIPSGAIQDYWGYVGRVGATVFPDVFFVLDEKARQLTDERTLGTARAEIAGSPKHEAYRPHVGRWTRRDTDRPGAPGRVVFFLQPRAVPGLEQNVAEYLEVIRGLDCPVSAALKLHPADADGGFLVPLLAGKGTDVEVIPADSPVEPELGRADVVVTCFSSVGLDHNYIQAYCDRAIGTVLYLTVGDAIKDFMRDIIGQDTVPGADAGMGVSFDSTETLGEWLKYALVGQAERRRYQRSVHENLNPRRSPSSSIANYIDARCHTHKQDIQ